MTIMNRRPTGVTRTAQKRLTEGLPQYEADDGPLTKPYLNQVKKAAPKAKAGTVCSNLFDRNKTQRSASSTGTSDTIDKNCSKSAWRPSAASVLR